MNNSKRVECYIKTGGSSKRCLLDIVHTKKKRFKFQVSDSSSEANSTCCHRSDA